MSGAIKTQIAEIISVLKERGLNSAKNALFAFVFHDDTAQVLTDLHKEFTLSYATTRYKRLMALSRSKKKDSGAFGFSDEWIQAIIDYLNNFLLNRAVLPVTDGTKKQILEVLNQAQQEGWSIDRIIQELTNKGQDELTDFRARRIVRTELTIASGFADKLVQDKVPFEVDKEWISVHDNRTRDSHNMMDGVVVDGNADFHVPIIKKKVQIGIDLMSGPGDPEATPGNVINCRCTKALIPKRDKKGRLISKQSK